MISTNTESLAREKYIEYEIHKVFNKGIYRDPINYDFLCSYPLFSELSQFEDEACKIFHKEEKNEIILYIHIPFCTVKCDYCYFFTLTRPRREKAKNEVNTYLNYLEKEIEMIVKGWNSPKMVKSIGIGGGTPSYLTKNNWIRLFEILKRNFQIAKEAEITVELSPDTIYEDDLEILRQLGISRISIGVQDFDLTVLKKMGRKRMRLNSNLFNKLKRYFNNINIDLIYGYPGQNIEHIIGIIDELKNIEPPSVTFYQLWTSNMTSCMRVHSKSQFPSAQENIFARIIIQEKMKELGYHQDLASWFIKSDKYQYKHQHLKWQNFPFLGIGPSSYGYFNNHVYLTYGKYPQNAKFNYNSSVNRQIKTFYELLDKGNIPIHRSKKLDNLGQLRRHLALGIKRSVGLNLSILARKYGLDPRKIFSTTINKLLDLELVQLNNNVLSLTEKGFLFDDEVGKILGSSKLDYNISEGFFILAGSSAIKSPKILEKKIECQQY